MSDFKEWYSKNSTDWNAERRSRYKSDPAYRETVLERNRKHRSEKKVEQVGELKEVREAQVKRVKSRWKKFEDKDGPRFSIGALAERLSVSVQAIRLWEHAGVIPPPAKRTTGQRGGKGTGQRLYTLDEIEKIRKIIKAQGKIGKNGKGSKEKVRVYDRVILFPGGKAKTMQVYTVGVLASAVARTVVTLEHLERKGYLPETPLRGDLIDEDGKVVPQGGRRFYTKPMIEIVKKGFEKRPFGLRGEEAWKGFCAEVLENWKKIGVMGASLKRP